MNGLTRRGLIAAGAGAASPFVLPRILARAQSAENPFTLGVASGEPWPDGFVLWTRLAPRPMAEDGRGGLAGPVPVRWEVAEDETMRRIVAAGDAQADERFGHSVHVEVAGLRPNRPYWYRFTALGSQSDVGLTRTAPAGGADLSRLKVVMAACAHYEVGYFSAYRHMAAERPDLIVFMGDYIYEYSYALSRETPRRHDRLGEIRDLAGYRNRYAQYKMDPDLQALHRVAPCLAIWDDHEVQNDYADAWSQNLFDQAGFPARRTAAYQAFYEHIPLRRRSIPRPDGTLRLYDRFAFGRLAEFNMLDGRQYRSIQASPTPNSRRSRVVPLDACADFTDPARTFLGAEQEAWLYDGFRRAPARWNIIAQPLCFAPYVQKGPGGLIGNYTDGWTGYGLSRQRLLDQIAGSRLANPIVLGGDLHGAVAADLHAREGDPGSPVVASEFVATSVTSDNSPASLVETADLNPHVKLIDVSTHGYVSLDVTRRRLEGRFMRLSDRRDPNAGVGVLRAFAVEAGKPGLVPA